MNQKIKITYLVLIMTSLFFLNIQSVQAGFFDNFLMKAIKVIVEMESMEAWGKLMDDPEMIAIQKVFADYVNNLKWTIWDEAGRLK